MVSTGGESEWFRLSVNSTSVRTVSQASSLDVLFGFRPESALNGLSESLCVWSDVLRQTYDVAFQADFSQNFLAGVFFHEDSSSSDRYGPQFFATYNYLIFILETPHNHVLLQFSDVSCCYSILMFMFSPQKKGVLQTATTAHSSQPL